MVVVKMNGHIKTQTAIRRDGRITVTVKLIGYQPGSLSALGYMETVMREIETAIRNAVIDAYNPRKA